MKTNEIVKKLVEAGFVLVSSKKHIKYKHPDGRWTVISKGAHDIDIDLIKKMEQQIQIKLR